VNSARSGPRPAERMLAIVQRGMRWELDAPVATGVEPLAARLARLDSAQWGEPQVLAGLLRELWLRLLCARGLDAEMARDAIAALDDESLLIALEGELTA